MISVITLILEFLVLFSSTSGGFLIADYTYIILMFVFTIAFMMDLLISKKLAYARGELFFAYFWRFFLLFFDIYGKNVYNLPNSGPDANSFYREAVAYVLSNGSKNAGSFATILGSAFRIVGTSRLYGQFLIMLMSVLAICIFARVLSELELDLRVKSWAVLLLGFLPNYAILSVLFLREAPVCLSLTYSVYCFYHWLKDGKTWSFLLAFAAALVGAWFHSGSVAVVIGYIAVIMLYDRQKGRYRPNMRSTLPAVLLSLVLIYLYLNYGDTLFGKFAKVDSLEDIGNTSEYGGSSYAQYVGNSATPLNMLIFTIPRIIYFLFSPFPWQWRGLSDIIAFFFSSLFYLVTVIQALRYLRSGNEKNRIVLIALLIVAAATTFVFAWGVSNTGTAARHREKMVLIYGMIYAISLEPKQAPRVILMR